MQWPAMTRPRSIGQSFSQPLITTHLHQTKCNSLEQNGAIFREIPFSLFYGPFQKKKHLCNWKNDAIAVDAAADAIIELSPSHSKNRKTIEKNKRNVISWTFPLGAHTLHLSLPTLLCFLCFISFFCVFKSTLVYCCPFHFLLLPIFRSSESQFFVKQFFCFTHKHTHWGVLLLPWPVLTDTSGIRHPLQSKQALANRKIELLPPTNRGKSRQPHTHTLQKTHFPIIPETKPSQTKGKHFILHFTLTFPTKSALKKQKKKNSLLSE